MLNADSSFLLLEEGRKTEALEISTHVGGGAVNAAVAMARLGLDVATPRQARQGCARRDGAGAPDEEGVSTRWAMRDGRAPTGASVLVSSHDRNAAIFTFRGANTLLEEADLRKEAFAADVVYVSSLSNESADAFPAIVERAKAQGALVATNPRVRQLSSRGGAFQETLEQIDILAVNRSEADVLVPGLVARFGEGGKALGLKPGEQLPRLAARGFAGGGHEMSLVGFFAALRQLGPRYVVVTDGRHGAFLGTQDAIMYCPCWRRRLRERRAPAMPSTPRLPPMWPWAGPPEEALRAAAVNAASVVGHVDTQTGLLSREEIDKRLAEAKATLEVRIWSH